MASVSITERQVATSERSVVARLDPATEERLYRLYREYYQRAEDERAWNLWEVISWDAALKEPPADLVSAAIDIYKDGIPLPDFSARLLNVQRASRGRAWFLTCWSYEEVKAHLAIREWLLCAGVSDETLKNLSDELMNSYRWEPDSYEPLPMLADALYWELRQIEKMRQLRTAAQTAGDPALTDVATRTLADHEAQRDFFRNTLRIISETYLRDVREAIKTATIQNPTVEPMLLALLDIPAA